METAGLILHGKRDFACYLSIWRWKIYTGLSGWVLNAITSVLRRGGLEGATLLALKSEEGDMSQRIQGMKL